MFYSEMYVLENGYKEFFGEHPDLCDGIYLPMVSEGHKDDCREKFGEVKRLHQTYSYKEACRHLQQHW